MTATSSKAPTAARGWAGRPLPTAYTPRRNSPSSSEVRRLLQENRELGSCQSIQAVRSLEPRKPVLVLVVSPHMHPLARLHVPSVSTNMMRSHSGMHDPGVMTLAGMRAGERRNNRQCEQQNSQKCPLEHDHILAPRVRAYSRQARPDRASANILELPPIYGGAFALYPQGIAHRTSCQSAFHCRRTGLSHHLNCRTGSLRTEQLPVTGS